MLRSIPPKRATAGVAARHSPHSWPGIVTGRIFPEARRSDLLAPHDHQGVGRPVCLTNSAWARAVVGTRVPSHRSHGQNGKRRPHDDSGGVGMIRYCSLPISRNSTP
jgi:hypothetical protein